MLREMLSDETGKMSNMRTMSLLSLFYLFFASTWQMLHDSINFEVLVLFATCAFAPKVIQKFAEKTRNA